MSLRAFLSQFLKKFTYRVDAIKVCISSFERDSGGLSSRLITSADGKDI